MKNSKSSFFKDIKLKWWQAGLFKISTISFGIILGIFFNDAFINAVPVLWFLVFVPGFYIAYIWLKK